MASLSRRHAKEGYATKHSSLRRAIRRYPMMIILMVLDEALLLINEPMKCAAWGSATIYYIARDD